MIELTIKVEQIDYNDLAELLLPLLSEQLPKSGLMGHLLRSPEKAQGLITELLARMPQKQKDELMARYINQNSSKAAAKLEEMAAKNGVSLKLSEVIAKVP